MDNDGAIDTAYNASINQKNKHIDIVHHFVRDCISQGKVKQTHCNSSEQAADPLTKPLERVLHERLSERTCWDTIHKLNVRGGVLEYEFELLEVIVQTLDLLSEST